MLKSLENNVHQNNLNNFKQDIGVAVTEKTNDEETQQKSVKKNCNMLQKKSKEN